MAIFTDENISKIKIKEKYKMSDNVEIKSLNITINNVIGYSVDGTEFLLINIINNHIQEKFYISYYENKFYFLASSYEEPLYLGNLSLDCIRVKIEPYYISLASNSLQNRKMKMCHTGRFISELIFDILLQLKEIIKI